MDDEVNIPLPARGPFEPAATKIQKNKLWRAGIKDIDALNKIGRDQAKAALAAIAARADQQRQRRSRWVVLVLLAIIAALAAVLWPVLKDR